MHASAPPLHGHTEKRAQPTVKRQAAPSTPDPKAPMQKACAQPLARAAGKGQSRPQLQERGGSRAWLNGRNRRECFSLGTPQPLSMTVNSTSSCERRF